MHYMQITWGSYLLHVLLHVSVFYYKNWGTITCRLHVHYIYYTYFTAITCIFYTLHLYHTFHICSWKMTFCIMWWQPTCSMSMRMFVPGHQPGLLFVLYRLWDQNQSGMSMGVIQSLWGTLSWWWNTMIACWGNLPSRLNVRKKIKKLNFIMFYDIYNV